MVAAASIACTSHSVLLATSDESPGAVVPCRRPQPRPPRCSEHEDAKHSALAEVASRVVSRERESKAAPHELHGEGEDDEELGSPPGQTPGESRRPPRWPSAPPRSRRRKRPWSRTRPRRSGAQHGRVQGPEHVADGSNLESVRLLVFEVVSKSKCHRGLLDRETHGPHGTLARAVGGEVQNRVVVVHRHSRRQVLLKRRPVHHHGWWG